MNVRENQEIACTSITNGTAEAQGSFVPSHKTPFDFDDFAKFAD